MSGRVQDRAREIGRQIGEIEVNETTIPDAFRRAPKLISPRQHRWLDDSFLLHLRHLPSLARRHTFHSERSIFLSLMRVGVGESLPGCYVSNCRGNDPDMELPNMG